MKRISILLIGLLTVITASAQRITADAALSKAKTFVQNRQASLSKGQSTNVLMLKEIEQSEILGETSGTQLFMYNIGKDNGFVIVSGDERIPDIIGYAESGSIDPNNIPENMRWWLEMYAQEIEHLSPTLQTSSMLTHAAIAPMITTKWNQSAPFNLQCPLDEYRNKVSYTGCVATAMAQVLHYIQPAGCTALQGYKSSYHNNVIEVPALSATTFNWNIMRDSYASNETDASTQEVAKLMRYCGQSVKAKYSSAATGASTSNAVDAFKDNFDLSKTVALASRYNYSIEQWDNLIYKELNNNRPIIISGDNFSTGHAFICDGYDGNGLYHFNWGWGGTSNGYFDLNHLNPKEQGIGGSNGGYSGDIEAIIGIRVKTGPEEKVIIPTCYEIVDIPRSSSRASAAYNFNFSFGAWYYSTNENQNKYEVCWGLYDINNNQITTSTKKSITTKEVKQIEGLTFNLAMGKGLPDGTYYLKPLGRHVGATEWELCYYAENNILQMEISGNIARFDAKKKTPKYEINSLTISESSIVNVNTILTTTIKNIGTAYSERIYVVVDDNPVSYIAGNIDPNMSEEYTAGIEFTSAGQHAIWLALESYDWGTERWVYNRISNKVYCDVIDEVICPLTFNAELITPSILNDNVYYVSTNECQIEVTYTNSTTDSYISSVGIYQGTKNYETNMLNYNTKPVTNSVIINPNSSEKVTYNFTLDDGTTHVYVPTYKTGSNTWYNFSAANAIRVCYNSSDGISSPVITTDNNSPIYTLDGRRVAYPTRGIYIRNGKKFIK